MWADPKSAMRHLAEPSRETAEIVGPGCKHLENEHLQPQEATVRTGTVSHSPLNPLGQPKYYLGATAIHGFALTAHVDPKAPITHSETPSDLRPWPCQRHMVHFETGNPACDPPGAVSARPGLTRDNLHLSRATPEASNQRQHDPGVQLIAQDDNRPMHSPEILEKVAILLRHSLAANTERAFESDLRHFRDWGGRLPASADTICSYIAAHAGALSVATIRRRIATLSKAHEAAGLVNPCRAQITKAALRGLKRKFGMDQRQAKPLMRDDLLLVLDRLGTTLRDQRDRALLLLGFAGGFRRSELVAVEHIDIETTRQGLIVTIRRSKTDQEGAGRRIGIPHGRTRHCPVAAVEAWLDVSGIASGPLFRPITRHGHMAPNHLTGDAVSVLLRERLKLAGIDPKNYSGHSLRAGFATSAAQAGISTLKIRQQTGHASDAMLARYVREGELFTGNAAAALL